MHRPDYFRRFLIIGLSGPIVALNVWILSQAFRYFEHLFTVVIIAAVLAFLLSYLVRLFERAHLSRPQAVGLVLLVSVTLLVILGLTLVPILIAQTTQLLQGIPAWLEASRQNLEWIDRFTKARNFPFDFSNLGSQVNARVEQWIEVVLGQIPGLAIGTVSWLFDIFLIIVLAFYMLLYGDRLWQGLMHLLPAHVGTALSESLQFNFQKFFIGQLLLGLFMVATLTPIFLFLKVGFGLLFALLIGMSELIPFIGATLGIGLVTFLVVLQNFWLALQVAFFAIVMQQIKDNLITPRLMGTFIGLNPIWILVALLAGAQIAGLLGILLSIPLAGTIKGTIEALRARYQPQIITTEPVSTDQP